MAAFRTSFTGLTLILALLLLPMKAWSEPAPAQVATVISIDGKGVAKLRRKSGIETMVAPLQRLQAGDKITTDDKSVVQLNLPDGTIVRIGLNSEYRIDSARADGTFVAWVFNLARGSVRALVEKSVPRKESKFRINTPAGTMGVRGTELILEHSMKTGLTTLYTLEGTVSFGPIDCEAKQNCAAVKAGQTSAISAGETAARPPGPFSAEDLIKSSASALKQSADGIAGDGAATDKATADSVALAARLSVLAPLSLLGQNPALLDGDALVKAVKASGEELAQLQDALLGRDRETREAMAAAAKDGTLADRLALGEALGKNAADKSLPGADSAVKKFKAASAYEAKKSGKAGEAASTADKLLAKILAQSPRGTGGIISASGASVAKSSADASAILQKASERLAETVKARNEALSAGKNEKAGQLAEEANKLAAQMKEDDARRAEEAEKVVMPKLSDIGATVAPQTAVPVAADTVSSEAHKANCGPLADNPICAAPVSCGSGSVRCGYLKQAWNSWCLECDRDRSLYFKRLADQQPEETAAAVTQTATGYTGGFSAPKKCTEVKKVCEPSVMIPCDLKSGKKCTPTFKPGKCQDKTVEKAC